MFKGYGQAPEEFLVLVYHKSQVSVAVVVHLTLTSGGVELHTCLFKEHSCASVLKLSWFVLTVKLF